MNCLTCKKYFTSIREGQVVCSRRCLKLAILFRKMGNSPKTEYIDALDTTRKLNIDLINRLYSNIKIVDRHWLWGGRKTPNIYGTIMINKKNYVAHRVSLCIYLKLDYYDPFWMACHLCPYKSCVNPTHLYEGNRVSNWHDWHRKWTFV